MKFLIQTINGIVKHDFSFTLLESIEYHKWLGNKDIEAIFTDETIIPDYIPIGSVEFVTNYLKTYFNIEPKPINVPNELMDVKFSNRNIINGTEKDIIGRRFVKSNDKIKSFTNICDKAPDGNYQISDIIDIESEWRCFIYQSKLVGLNNYSGEFDIFPDMNLIKEMIATYKEAPIAYTLDVGIFNNKTFVIEVHDFFSCGFYGFSNHKILPFMFNRWFNEFVQKNYISKSLGFDNPRNWKVIKEIKLM